MTKKSEIPFGAQLSHSTDSPHQEFSEQSLSQILASLKSSRKQVRSGALDLLAIYLTRLIGLDFKGWLLRSTDSNDIEAAIIAYDRHVLFSCWQIQCRNTGQVDMEEIATAIGRSVPFSPNIVLSATTGHFTQHACYYVTRAMQLTTFQIILLDGHDLRTLASDEKAIKSILERETKQAQIVKQSQLLPLYT